MVKAAIRFSLFSLLTLSSTLTVAQETPKSLDDIFAPVVVGVPPSDAYIGLSRLESGEIRHYNYGEQANPENSIYLSSSDNGLSWRSVKSSNNIPYADIQSPISGEYIRVFEANREVWALRTSGGIEGDRMIRKIDTELAIMLKPPVFVEGGKRIIVAGHRADKTGCFTYVSTDDGVTWQQSNKLNTPFHTIGGVHKGIRWNHGAVEPTVVELQDGRLWMIIRTSLDYHYQSFSEDGGMTWSEPTQSPFYGTITMPTFYKMADGRILFFWSNTTPLPEEERATTGKWEDVFTNRSASHVAISEDDGQSWIGMRELILDDMRNAEDFGTSAGRDKSVHQAQAVEVADGKILVSAGQNKMCRRMLLFDVDWLYEDSRSCDFSDGLENWTALRYYKGIVGHCGYNRQEAPLLVDHPDKSGERVMRIGYTPNDELVDDRDGAVWNFPAARNGELSVRLMIPEGAQSVDLILNDRWFNPTDEVARDESQYCVALNRKSLKIRDSKWHDVKVSWNEGGRATVMVDGKRVMTTPLIRPALHGVSYLHLLGGKTSDMKAIYIESVAASAR